MNNQLRQYIENVFSEAPPTPAAIEMKEEFIQNLNDKYNDLIAEGKSEEAAFNIAVASIGDVSGLVNELKGLPQQYNEMTEKNKQINKNRSLIIAIAVSLYILCAVPNIIFGGSLGVTLMFVMIALATGLLIFNSTNKPQRGIDNDTVVGEFQEWRTQNNQNTRMYKSITSAVWSLGVVIYVMVSFFTSAWHLTWLIFIIIGAVNGIIRAAFDLKKEDR